MLLALNQDFTMLSGICWWGWNIALSGWMLPRRFCMSNCTCEAKVRVSFVWHEPCMHANLQWKFRALLSPSPSPTRSEGTNSSLVKCSIRFFLSHSFFQCALVCRVCSRAIISSLLHPVRIVAYERTTNANATKRKRTNAHDRRQCWKLVVEFNVSVWRMLAQLWAHWLPHKKWSRIISTKNRYASQKIVLNKFPTAIEFLDSQTNHTNLSERKKTHNHRHA